MTFTSILSRLTNNFSSRLILLFSKTTHLNFWNNLLKKNTATKDESYNLAPLVGIIIGFVIASIAILGRLFFSYRIIATIVAFVCYLFFGYVNVLYGFALTVSNLKNEDTINVNVDKFGIIAIILAIALWCTCVTYMRPARLFLSLMSAVCLSRFASCLVVYIANCQEHAEEKKEHVKSFDKVDLIVAICCTVPWLILCLERCLPTLSFAIIFAISIMKFLNRNSSDATAKISSTAIVVTEIFSLLIWLI
ncbi:MAG: hypothetical protein Q4C78_00340 [Synergistaceae bacterium]|nr:hypothetical protein [Synergistaceae bacterium]